MRLTACVLFVAIAAVGCKSLNEPYVGVDGTPTGHSIGDTLVDTGTGALGSVTKDPALVALAVAGGWFLKGKMKGKMKGKKA